MFKMHSRTDANDSVKTGKMWCSNHGCDCYGEENDCCNRIGTNGTIGVCWMEKSEGEY